MNAPTIDHLINVVLRSACPPPDAIFQYPGFTRPGNNYQSMPGVYQDVHGNWGHNTQHVPLYPCDAHRFYGYKYLPTVQSDCKH